MVRTVANIIDVPAIELIDGMVSVGWAFGVPVASSLLGPVF